MKVEMCVSGSNFFLYSSSVVTETEIEDVSQIFDRLIFSISSLHKSVLHKSDPNEPRGRSMSQE